MFKGKNWSEWYKDSKDLEQVKFYKYLVSIVNGDNSIAKEIKERIAVGSKTYYANPKIFESKLLSKRAKLQLYWTIIRPVITWASKTWVLKESMKQKSLITKRKIFRSIIRYTKDREGTWWVKSNDEFTYLLHGAESFLRS